VKSDRGGAGVVTPSRSRGAAASKDALLRAAQVLFSMRGFEGSTIREIGDKAGVDPALIARYFGSKADLYIAAVAADDLGSTQDDDYDSLLEIVDAVITRSDERGPGPVLQAAVRSDTSTAIKKAAHSRLKRRLVAPVSRSMEAQGLNQPQLRAEVAVAALFGVSLARSLGWFEDIRKVPRDDLVALIAEMLGEQA
jgi:AcrR family transcriptional regulator